MYLSTYLPTYLPTNLPTYLPTYLPAVSESRETAYIYAISSAGVMYAVTRACAKGELLKCGCDRRVRRRHATDGTFEWGGCSDNIRYGSRFSKEFVDSNELNYKAEGLMNLWNNGAGRKVSVLIFFFWLLLQVFFLLCNPAHWASSFPGIWLAYVGHSPKLCTSFVT